MGCNDLLFIIGGKLAWRRERTIRGGKDAFRGWEGRLQGVVGVPLEGERVPSGYGRGLLEGGRGLQRLVTQSWSA